MHWIGQRSHPVQQIPDRVLSVIHLVGETVEAAGQLPALLADIPDAVADLGQRLIDLGALRDLLGIE